MPIATAQPKTKNAAPLSVTPAPGGLLQRKCACGQHTTAGGECAECRKKREAVLQRAPLSPVGRGAGGEAVPPIVHDVLRSPGQPLDPATRSFMEPRFGHDFSRVRVHTDSKAAESARAVNALAYTVGRDVVFGAGQHVPGTSAGQRLLAHELAHVVQQKGVSASLLSPMKSGSEHGLEKEAETVSTAIGQEQVSVLHQTQTLAIQRQGGGTGGGGAAPTAHRFSAEGVNVVVRRSCAATLGFAAVEAATRTALDRIFNSECIEESRRTRIQRNLTRNGLDIRCATLTNACAEATGFFIPANIMTLNTDRTNCPPLESSILHEIIHLTRGIFAERLPESCDNSCLGTARGVPPDLCRDIDVFGRRVRAAP